jgi:hypothetical protein
LAGTWNVSVDNGWKCIEQGHLTLYKKLCKEGKNVLPQTFMNNRTEVVPYMAFTKDGISGGVINLQQQFIELESNALVIIINM